MSSLPCPFADEVFAGFDKGQLIPFNADGDFDDGEVLRPSVPRHSGSIRHKRWFED